MTLADLEKIKARGTESGGDGSDPIDTSNLVKKDSDIVNNLTLDGTTTFKNAENVKIEFINSSNIQDSVNMLQIIKDISV